jgi:hypothetical protein
MLRVLLLISSLTVSALAQELPNSDYSAVSNFTAADMDSTSREPVDAVPLESRAITSDNLTSAAGVSSSATLPRLAGDLSTFPASNAMLLEPVIATSTAKLTERPSLKQQRVWWALTAAQHGAATFDAWSTRKSLESGNGYERNPLLRPFAGSPAIYPVIQALPLGLDYLSKRMMQSRHGIFRKTWWVPQTIATAGFVWSGAHNLSIANRK